MKKESLYQMLKKDTLEKDEKILPVVELLEKEYRLSNIYNYIIVMKDNLKTYKYVLNYVDNNLVIDYCLSLIEEKDNLVILVNSICLNENNYPLEEYVLYQKDGQIKKYHFNNIEENKKRLRKLTLNKEER